MLEESAEAFSIAICAISPEYSLLSSFRGVLMMKCLAHACETIKEIFKNRHFPFVKKPNLF